MYTATSIDVFIAAYAGAMGSYNNERIPNSDDPTHYNRVSRAALAYAEEFDTIFAVALPNELQLSDIESISGEVCPYPNNDTNAFIPGSYLTTVNAVIAMMAENSAIVAANVTNPIPVPTPVSQTVLTIATVVGATDSLKATVPTSAVSAIVEGYTTAGDGGGGLFFWSPASAAVDNVGTIVNPTAHVGNGRWIRIYSGALEATWFGAKGDGVTDDRPAFVSAIAAMTNGASLYVNPDRTYLFNTPAAPGPAITITLDDVSMFSDGPGAIIHLKKGLRGLDVTGCNEFEMYGLQWTGTIQVDGGDPGGGNETQTAIKIATSNNVNIHDCTFKNLGGYGVFPHTGNVNVNIHDNQFLETMAGCQAGGGDVNTLWITDNYFLGFIPTGGAGTLGSDDMIAFFGSAAVGTNGQVIISRNIIDKQGPQVSNQARAIDVTCEAGATGGLIDLIVEDNICIGCSTLTAPQDRAAIVIAGSPDGASAFRNLSVSRNIIRLCNQGIELSLRGIEDYTINDNKIFTVTRLVAGATIPTGIRIITATGGTVRGRMNGNICEDIGGDNTGSTAGILVDNVTNLELGSNMVSNSSDMGIKVSNGTNVNVHDNQIKTCLNVGLYLTTIANLTSHDNDIGSSTNHGFLVDNITGGTLEGNNSHNHTLAGMGTLGGCSDVSFIGNVSHNNGLYGFAELGTNVALGIIGNQFYSNTQYGISFQGTNSNGVISSNRLRNNTNGPISDTSTTSTWIDSPATWYNAQAVQGANLTDADATIGIGGGNVRILFATLTGNRTLAVDTTGTPEVNETITFILIGAGAFTYTINNSGPGAGTLYTKAASVLRIVTIWWDGTNWNPGDVQRAVAAN